MCKRIDGKPRKKHGSVKALLLATEAKGGGELPVKNVLECNVLRACSRIYGVAYRAYRDYGSGQWRFVVVGRKSNT